MNTDLEKRRPTTDAPSRGEAPSRVRLDSKSLGLGFGATGVLFYLGCMLTMATVPRNKAVVFFNSLLHGLNVEPILQTSVPAGEVALGLVTTFILGWFAGVLIAGFYNWGLSWQRRGQ